MAPATSEDSELAGSLETLRNRSRKMIRDNPHASNLKRIVQDNIVGTGIGVQAQVMKADGTPDDDSITASKKRGYSGRNAIAATLPDSFP